MSLKNKLFSIAASGLAVAAFSTYAAAQTSDSTTVQPQTDAPRTERPEGFHKHGGGHGGERGMRGDHALMGGLRDLNLTDAQKTQIHSIMEANRPDQSSSGEMKTLIDAKRSGTLTDAQKEQFKALRQQQKAKMEQVHQQILAVLTDEQRTQLEQKQKERREQFEQRRQNRRQNGQTPTTPTQN